MPPPTSIHELLDLTRKSGIVDDARLANYVQQLRSGQPLPETPTKLAGQMVRDGLLTLFQAEQLCMGKWKRFYIGKYKVLEKLGSGGMGQVFLCEHKVMKRRVAVKVLPTAKADDSSSLERFHREARVVAALDHVNIVRAYDIDQDDNLHFLVMEYVDGVSLQDLVKKHGPLDPLRASHYAYQSALGLQHAFDVAGIIHRDIKPGNVLVDRQGVVKILDMGLARFFHDEEDLLTKQYDETVLGTADYLAPEQAVDSHNVDMRADIYSLGATFYFMLTGQPPFTDGTVAQKLIWHQNREPKPIREIRPEVPREIAAVVERMMAKDRDRRYQTHCDVAEAMLPIVATPIPPPPEHEMPRLSPAAMGTNGPVGSSGSPTRVIGPVSPSPLRSASRPELPSPAASKPVTPSHAPTAFDTSFDDPIPTMPVVTPRPAPVVEPPPVWQELATETPTPRAGQFDTGPTPPLKTSSSRGNRIDTPLRFNRRKWLLIGGGIGLIALIALLAVIVVVVALGKKPPPLDNNAAVPSGSPLIVETGNAPRDGALTRVAHALARAKPGDRILVRGPIVEEYWTGVEKNRFAPNVSVEADVPAGEFIPWHLPANADPKAVLTVANMEGVKFKGFAFDGQGRAENGIYIHSRCAGVTFEDCEVRNCTQSGIKISNAAGEPDRPLTLSRVKVSGRPGMKTLFYLFASPNVTNNPTSHHVRIQECVAHGPSSAMVLIEGSHVGVMIQRSRFLQSEAGVVLRPTRDTTWTDVVFESNTFHRLNEHAVLLEGPSDQITINSTITFRRNLFTHCKSLLHHAGEQPLPKIESSGNGWDTATAEGSGKLEGRSIGPVTFQSEDPADGAKFLRYAKNAPANLKPLGPVGVPPLD